MKYIDMKIKFTVEWGEAVEALSEAVVNNGVNMECQDIRRCTIFLSHRILRRLQIDMREEKSRRVSDKILSGHCLFELI